MTKINITGEVCDLNTYIKALNNNRFGGNKIKQDETNRVYQECKVQKVSPVKNYPITLIYNWYSKNERKDIDNVAFAKKFINDGLVLAGVLQDDSRKYVSGFEDNFFIDKENPRVEVEIIYG
jgi:Holliday junction resolvase RusA-like endonuclease